MYPGLPVLHYFEPSASLRELRLLEALAECANQSQSALAQAVGLTPARVNAYIRKFIDQHYVTTTARDRNGGRAA